MLLTQEVELADEKMRRDEQMLSADRRGPELSQTLVRLQNAGADLFLVPSVPPALLLEG